MLLKKTFLASVLAASLLSPAMVRASEGGSGESARDKYEHENKPGLSIGKISGKADRTPYGSESDNWRQRYGGYSAKANGGRANRANDPYRDTAYNAQKKVNENSKNVDLLGIKTKEANVFQGATKKGPCDLSYKALGAQAGGNIGVTSSQEREGGKAEGPRKTGLSCMAGVEGTLISGKVECKNQLLGNEDLGADVKYGGEAGAKANLSCKCNGGSILCEAMIGVKAGIDGSIGGTLCGLRLGIGAGGDVGAGLGARAQIGKTAAGYGFSIGAYAGVGLGGSVYIDPKLDGLLEGKTYTCLAEKGKAAAEKVGGFLASLRNGVVRVLTQVGEQQIAAAAGGGGFLVP